MRDKNQNMRFNDSELSFIKAVFADDAEITYIIRKSMLQLELTDQEKEVLKISWNPEISKLCHKMFLPDLEGDAPLFQLTNLVLALGSDTKGLSPDGAWPFIKAKELEINYLQQQLDVLDGKNPEIKIVLKDMINLDYPKKEREQVWVNVTAWNWLLSFIDSNLAQAKVLAGRKEETVEQTRQRLERDSAK